MRRRILIITEANDLHAIAVAESLERKGGYVTLWATSDFPTQEDESILFDAKGARTLGIHGKNLELRSPAFDVVWRRRPTFVLDHDALHPADRAFAESECGLFRRSLFQMLAPDAFWVNPPAGAARAGSKLLQAEAAAKIGFKMPETLFSNSPREIRNFLTQAGATIYKPLSPVGWRDGDRQFAPYTSLVTEEDLVADEVLRQTPGIYQKRVEKLYELRLTVLGEHVLAVKVLSQETQTGRLDWRKSYHELRFEQTVIPVAVSEQCVKLLRELGLVFGTFDLIVTPAREHVFLEVNEMGQFLFLEHYCGQPLLDIFSEFLLQGRTDFTWSEENVTVRYSDPDFEASAMARAKAFRASHVGSSERLVNEASS